MAIKWLLKWVLFKIDAVGLATPHGADDVNRAIGCLSKSPTDRVPAGFVVARDSKRVTVPRFAVYNISNGIDATVITGSPNWLRDGILGDNICGEEREILCEASG